METYGIAVQIIKYELPFYATNIHTFFDTSCTTPGISGMYQLLGL